MIVVLHLGKYSLSNIYDYFIFICVVVKRDFNRHCIRKSKREKVYTLN